MHFHSGINPTLSVQEHGTWEKGSRQKTNTLAVFDASNKKGRGKKKVKGKEKRELTKVFIL